MSDAYRNVRGEDFSEVYVLTHEYSDKSAFYICGVTVHLDLAMAWINGGDDTHAYKIPFNKTLPRHPRSQGWPEFTAPDRIGKQGDKHESESS